MNIISTMETEMAEVMQKSIEDGIIPKIIISNGARNRKTGSLIDSFSLPPVITCAEACPGCYAEKMVKVYPSVRRAYINNHVAYTLNPDAVFATLYAHCIGRRFFRFFVSGDFPDYDFLVRTVDLCKSLSGCRFQIFTKRYNFVNRYVSENGALPENLTLIFSMPLLDNDVNAFNAKYNPYNLPVCTVYDDPETLDLDKWVGCMGNCTECACFNTGCWALKSGDVLAIRYH